MHVVCSEVKTTRSGGVGLVFLDSCESEVLLSHVRDLTKIPVGLSWRYPGQDFTQTNSLVNYYNFSDEGSLLVPRPFRILYEEFCMRTKEKVETLKLNETRQEKEKETTRQLERSTRARTKRVVTIPIDWVKSELLVARGSGHSVVVCFSYSCTTKSRVLHSDTEGVLLSWLCVSGDVDNLFHIIV